MNTIRGIAALVLAAFYGNGVIASDVKRQDVFDFQEKPRLIREDGVLKIVFSVKAFCDATVAVENSDGKIIRHLASGVLGDNAPPPFAKNSLEQTVLWDGKDDTGRYVENHEPLDVRVSLGLKPQYERCLFWTPLKRTSDNAPIVCPAEDGVYVYEGGDAINHLRMYDRDGNYKRTVYPFPSNQIVQSKDLFWHTFPGEQRQFAVKPNFLQSGMLTSGDDFGPLCYNQDSNTYESQGIKGSAHYGMYGRAATCMALSKDQIGLACLSLNRLNSAGRTGSPCLQGQRTSCTVPDGSLSGVRGKNLEACPTSAALSPDGKWLYLTGYTWTELWGTSGFVRRWLDVVTRLEMAGNGLLEVFAGGFEGKGTGTEDAKFRAPDCVVCDAHGIVYIADYMNDRVQVFQPDGKHIRNIAATKPAWIAIDEKRNEIYVFSWLRKNTEWPKDGHVKVPATLTRLGPLDHPSVIRQYPLPLFGYTGTLSPWDKNGGCEFAVALDTWTNPPRIWLTPSSPSFLPTWGANASAMNAMNAIHATIPQGDKLGMQLYEVTEDKLTLLRSFGSEADSKVARQKAPPFSRQRLYVNPVDGVLYLGEGQREDGTGSSHAFQELIRIDPTSGASRRVTLPFDAEDVAFDIEGMIYLRTPSVVGRFQFSKEGEVGSEVPWDYGEEDCANVGHSCSNAGKRGQLSSGLQLLGSTRWHHGGMYITPSGNLVAGVFYHALGGDDDTLATKSGQPYQPPIYPGRALAHTHGATLICEWDKHGRVIHKDAVPGLAEINGVALDKHDNIYVMTDAARVSNGTRYYNDMAGTLIKFHAGAGRVLSAATRPDIVPVPLAGETRPTRPADLMSGKPGGQWVEGAEWLYGGVGFGGKNKWVGCGCWNARPAFDYFDRSFAPETDRYSVAVLDSSGNLIVRIGAYGNVDDGVPLVADGGPPSPRSIGGDEVVLFHGAYLGTHTDHRLFIADPGNARILSVRLNYHATEKVLLDADIRPLHAGEN